MTVTLCMCAFIKLVCSFWKIPVENMEFCFTPAFSQNKKKLLYQLHQTLTYLRSSLEEVKDTTVYDKLFNYFAKNSSSWSDITFTFKVTLLFS